MYQIEYFEHDNKTPVRDWLHSIDKAFRARVHQRLIRVSEGNYGDYKVIDSSLKELRFTFGAGYRIYFTEIDNKIVLLLTAGDKNTQDKDIEKATQNLEIYKRG